MLTNTVKTWRESSRISKAHLARQIGVCRSYISRLEAGVLQPSGDVMFRIAGYFRVPIEQIFQRVEAQKRGQTFFGTNPLPNGNERRGDFFVPVVARPVCKSVATLPARPAGRKKQTDKSPVSPAAKAVASPVASVSQKKRNETE